MRSKDGTCYSFTENGTTYVIQFLQVHDTPPVPHGPLVRVLDWKREGDGPLTPEELDEAVAAETRFFAFLFLWASVRDGSLSRCGHRSVPEHCSTFPLLRYYNNFGPNNQRRCRGLWDGENFYPREDFSDAELLLKSLASTPTWLTFVDDVTSGWTPADYPLDFPVPKPRKTR